MSEHVLFVCDCTSQFQNGGTVPSLLRPLWKSFVMFECFALCVCVCVHASHLPVDVLLQADSAVGRGAAAQGVGCPAAALALTFDLGLELASLHFLQGLDGHPVHRALQEDNSTYHQHQKGLSVSISLCICIYIYISMLTHIHTHPSYMPTYTPILHPDIHAHLTSQCPY